MATKAKKRTRKVADPADGWGIRVGGALPYIAYGFYMSREEAQAECTKPYHRVVRVRIVQVEPK